MLKYVKIFTQSTKIWNDSNSDKSIEIHFHWLKYNQQKYISESWVKHCPWEQEKSFKNDGYYW